MDHLELDLQGMMDRVERMSEDSQVKQDFATLINEVVFLRTRHDLRGVALEKVIEELKQV